MPRKLKVPTSDVVSTKWGDVTPGRAGYYEKNASVAGAAWEDGAKGAEPAYRAALAAADIAKRFLGGIARAGASKFTRKIKDVGVSRFGPGVQAATADMKTGVEPYLAELGTIEVPDRGPRGSPGNYAIGQKIGDPLHKKRLSLLGAGS